MKRGSLLTVCVLAALTSAVPAASFAQSRPEYHSQRINMVLYKPDTGPAPHIAVLVAHRTADQLDNSACIEFAKRGIAGLCFNTRFVNNETAVNWEETALDVKVAVDFARTVPGITKVLLLGHSGGGALMTFYQAVAENGMKHCQGANKLMACTNMGLANLRPADGLLLPEAHPGNGAQALRGINPSLSIVNGKVVVDPALDPFDARNGYSPNGASRYPEDFRRRYYAAQSRVMNAQIDQVLALQARIKRGEHIYPDSDIVLVPFSDQAGAARLDQMDPSIPEIMSTQQPRKFLKNDGAIVTQIVKSIEPAHPQQAQINRTFGGGTKVLTIESYLSANSVRSTNSLDGIDECSTMNSTICDIQSIRVPTLIAAMGAYHLLRDEEIMYEKSAAADKDYIVIEGAVLGYTGCRNCGAPPETYANAEKNLFDYMAKWANERF
jgi:hypothetical protein